MRKDVTPGDSAKNIIETQNNAIGLTEMKLYRKDAHNALSKAKAQEAEKIAQGYKWVSHANGYSLVKP